MAKDPFNNIPPIEEEVRQEPRPARGAAPAPDRFDEQVTRGNAPRNLTRSISKFAVPIAAAAILVWLFMPNEPGMKRAATVEGVVDPTRQAAQTNALIEGLKDSANKVPRKPVPEPVVQAMPLPLAPLPAELDQDSVRRRLEDERREWEIRSAPLVANGTFTLATDEASPKAVLSRSRAFDVQAEIAANDAARAAAGRDQERMFERALATSQDAEPVKEKAANMEFLEKQARASNGHDVVRQQSAASRYIVNQGSVIRSVLLTGVNSDLPGTVKAQVTSDVYDSIYQRHVLIPKGSTMIGAYNSEIATGQERLMMAMTRVIFPNGTWASLSGTPGADSIGQSGMEADVNNHFWKIFGTSLVLGAASTFLPDRQTTITATPSEGGMTQGGTTFGMALNDTLRTLLERNKNIAPTLTLRPGQEFTLMVAKDMVLQPYR